MADKKEPKPKAEKKPKKPEAIKHYAIFKKNYEDQAYTFVDEFEGTLREAREYPKRNKAIEDGTYWAFEDVSGPIIKSTKTETVVSVTSTPPRKRKASA